MTLVISHYIENQIGELKEVNLNVSLSNNFPHIDNNKTGL